MYILVYISIFIIAVVFGASVLIYAVIKGRHELVKPTVLALITLAIILISHYYYYFERDVLTKQIVNISPLQHVKLSRSFLSIKDEFKDYKVTISDGVFLETKRKNAQGKKEEMVKEYGNGGFTRIILFYKEDEACRHYAFLSKNDDVYKIDTKGRDDGGSYCISYVTANRSDPEGGSLLMGTFRSFVLFQKQNILISVSEDNGRSSEGNGKNEIIQDIANRLAKFAE